MTAATSQGNANVRRLRTFKFAWFAFYLCVLIFTAICLGMAGSLKSKLADSDLTRFLPFALFVCCVSLIIIFTLGFCATVFQTRSPISTKIELLCLSIAAIIWLALGLYLATSPSQDADVECFASETSTVPLDDELASFHTQQYHAMYRVLNAFALVNAVLVILAVAFLFFLAVRSHRRGDEHMLYSPVLYCAWFIDSKPNRSNSRSSTAPLTREKSSGGAGVVPARREPSRSKPQRTGTGNSTTRPPPARRGSSRRHGDPQLPSRQNSGNSGHRLLDTDRTDAYNAGYMYNPAR